MKSFSCVCGNTVFFENTRCVACENELGWCPACASITALLADDSGQLRCGHSECDTLLVKCHNYAVENVCNRCLVARNDASTRHQLCDYCRYNHTIPDLSVPGNRENWLELEVAKRRLLYTLDLLGLPYGNEHDGFEPPLSFDFKTDVLAADHWSSLSLGGKEERVYTGHANGKIVINLREADAVEREKARVEFNEAHRTLIGHFRHEIAHYYWELLVQGRCEAECKSVFGDHENPTYAAAQQQYYAAGPPNDWRHQFISAYATMHPWEDFAETFAAYLDMISVLDTAYQLGIDENCNPVQADVKTMADHYGRLGVLLNELNRAMGLMDLVPVVLVEPVVSKMQFVHDLIRGSANRTL